MDYQDFLERVSSSLLKRGWRPIEGRPEEFDLVVSREDITALVRTKRMICFLRGNHLSRDEVHRLVERAHGLMDEMAMPPLFQRIAIVVFVFEKANGVEWIVEEARKRDVLRSNYTVSWIVDLTKGVLRRHKGLPLIRSGEGEINEALRLG